MALEGALGPRGSKLSPSALEGLEALDDILTRWSQGLSVEGFQSHDERVRRYFAEAVAARRFLPGGSGERRVRALDIGSGGGSPALPLAIVEEAIEWTLLESNERRALFLDEVARAVGLANVAVARRRFETWTPGGCFDVVTVRGVAMDSDALKRVGAHLSSQGRFLWFSSEKRLSSGRAVLERQSWSCEGPRRLVPEGGYLLVAEKCFT